HLAVLFLPARDRRLARANGKGGASVADGRLGGHAGRSRRHRRPLRRRSRAGVRATRAVAPRARNPRSPAGQIRSSAGVEVLRGHTGRGDRTPVGSWLQGSGIPSVESASGVPTGIRLGRWRSTPAPSGNLRAREHQGLTGKTGPPN